MVVKFRWQKNRKIAGLAAKAVAILTTMSAAKATRFGSLLVLPIAFSLAFRIKRLLHVWQL